MGKALVIAAIVVGAALVLALIVYVVHNRTQRASVRRRDYRQAQQVAYHAQVALRHIEAATDTWRDLESPLAMKIRTLIQEFREKKEELEK